MAVTFFFDNNKPVTKEALEKLEKEGKLEEFLSTDESLPRVIDKSVDEDVTPFSEIGINKPICIEILYAYSGELIKKGWRKKRNDILLTTSVKTIATHDKAAKAINLIKKDVKSKSYFSLSADDDGASIVYYNNALDVEKFIVTFELIADNFNNKIFGKIRDMMSGVGNLPVFAAAKSVLMAGSAISNMFDGVGDKLFETPPFMEDDLTIVFNRGGLKNSTPRFFILYNDEHKDQFTEYKIGYEIDHLNDTKTPALIHHSTGKKYKGSAPFILCSIDGRESMEYQDFVPRMASAALLEQFYGSHEGEDGRGGVEIMQQAAGFFNDFTYHNKAKKLEEEIDGMDGSEDNYETKVELLAAYKNNIVSDQFKLEEEE